MYCLFSCPPISNHFILIQRTKKARTKLCVSVFEVFDYLSIKYTSKAHANGGVSVIALLLMEFESVEVSKTRIKAKRFPNMSKMCVSVIR